MAILEHDAFQEFVAQEFKKTTIPAGPARRLGAQEHSAEVMRYIRRDLHDVGRLHKEESISLEKATNSITELVLELTSFLYAAGADHRVWRRWASLTAFGMFLTGQIHEAAQFAILGGEWNFLKVLPAMPVKSKQVSDLVLWILVWSKPIQDLPESARDDEGNAWLQLMQSIPAQDHRRTEEALKNIANFWMAENEGDWMNFHPRSYPDFHTPVCAAAAIARHQGFMPTSLTQEQYRFLEAGLAISEPPPMFPTHFSLPEQGGDYS
jgi:hypothetical protein